jgi:hypothetical protein
MVADRNLRAVSDDDAGHPGVADRSASSKVKLKALCSRRPSVRAMRG